MFEAHRRQFVISREPFVSEGWATRDLGDGFTLCYQPDLPLEDIEDGALVLGDRLISGDAGKFVTISGGRLSGDAFGLKSIYYLNGGDGPVVTSSPSIAQKLGGGDRHDRNPRWGGLNWFPPPLSPIAGVRRLLCDQTLDYKTLETAHRPKTVKRCASVDAACSSLADHLVRQLREIDGSRIFLALTAGLDSRLLLAALVASGVRFETFTQGFAGSRTDVRVAQALSKRFGIPHHLIESKPTAQALDQWREHTAFSVSDTDDNILVPNNQYRDFQAGDVLIRGGCFEAGRYYYGTRLFGLGFSNASAKRIWRRFDGSFQVPPDVESGLEQWLEWRRENDIGLSLPETFYVDQRIGGWLASIEQGLDGFPFRSINPGNSMTVLNAMATPDMRERRSGRVQKETSELLAPGVLDIPVNPGPPAQKFFHRAGKGARLVYRLVASRWSSETSSSSS